MARVVVFKSAVGSINTNPDFYKNIQLGLSGLVPKVEKPPDANDDEGRREESGKDRDEDKDNENENEPVDVGRNVRNRSKNGRANAFNDRCSAVESSAASNERVPSRVSSRRKQRRVSWNTRARQRRSNVRDRRRDATASPEKVHEAAREPLQESAKDAERAVTAKRKVNGQCYTCDACSLSFLFPRNLQSHKHYYSMKRNHVCKTCNAGFDRRARLESHAHLHEPRRSNSGRMVTCHFCQRLFRTKSHLQPHLFHFHWKDIFGEPPRGAGSPLKELTQSSLNKMWHRPVVKGAGDSLKESPVADRAEDAARTSPKKRSLNPATKGDANAPSKATTIEPLKEIADTPPRKSPLASTKVTPASGGRRWYTPVKKMRQTTLAEFARSPCVRVKPEPVSPEKMVATSALKTSFPLLCPVKSEPVDEPVDVVNDETVDGARDAPELLKKSPGAPGCPDSKEPFVKVFVDSFALLGLLQDSAKSVKTEKPDDAWLFDAACGVREASPSASEGTSEKTTSGPDDNGSSDATRSRRRYARAASEWTVAKEALLCRLHNCRPCTVPLERCDDRRAPEAVEPTIRIKRERENSLALDKENVTSVLETVTNETNASVANTISGSARDSVVSAEDGTNSDGAESRAESLARKPVRIATTSRSVADSSVIKEEPGPDATRGLLMSHTYACRICDRLYYSKESRRLHVRLCHVVYASSVCGARFTAKRKLLHHYLCQHAPPRVARCCVCRESFRSRVEMARHLSVHCIGTIRAPEDTAKLDEEPRCNVVKKNHWCKGCGKGFWLRSCLEQHLRVCRLWRERSGRQAGDSGRSWTIESIGQANEEGKSNGGTMEGVEAARSCVDEQETLSRTTLDDFVAVSPPKDELLDAVERLSGEPNGRSVKRSPVASERAQQRNSSCIEYMGQMWSMKQAKAALASLPEFSCDVCGRRFRAFRSFWSHKRAFSGGASETCDTCGSRFFSGRQLHTHLKSAHAPAVGRDYVHRCVTCGQGFDYAEMLREHEAHFHDVRRAHDRLSSETEQLQANGSFERGDRESSKRAVTCTVCKVAFESHERYMEHNVYYHGGTTYSCSFCGQCFRGMYLLHRHNKLEHYPEKAREAYAFVCDACGEGFKLRAHYHAHTVHVHVAGESGERVVDGVIDAVRRGRRRSPRHPYACTVCRLVFPTASMLLIHRCRYPDHEGYRCDACRTTCRSLDDLAAHQEANHSRPPGSARFAVVRGSGRKGPIVVERVGDKFSCTACGSSFFTEAGVREHLREHLREHSHDDSRAPGAS